MAAACASGTPQPVRDAVAVDAAGFVASAEVCGAVGADADGDLLADACELHLARLFAPLLVVAPGGCNWDDTVQPPRLGGEYYFGAQPWGRDTLRLAYLPAYYRDCGWSGAKCLLPFVDCARHAGDSELIVVDVTLRGGRWVTAAVFLSAHCFGRSDPGCRWYRGAELEAFAWADDVPLGAPSVWVAEGRQANYPSRAECDRGHFHIDTCAANRLAYRFPVASSAQNIGSRTRPAGGSGGCVGGRAAGWRSARVDPAAVECLWDGSVAFRGWQRPETPGDATSYAVYLDGIAAY